MTFLTDIFPFKKWENYSILWYISKNSGKVYAFMNENNFIESMKT